VNKYIAFLCCLFFITDGHTQKDTAYSYLKIQYSEDKPLRFLSILESSGQSTFFLESLIREQLSNYQVDGYLEASLDKFFLQNDSVLAVVHIGQKWDNVIVHLPTNVDTLLSPTLISQYKNVSTLDLESLMGRTAAYLADSGYPFTTVSFKKSAIVDDEIFMDLVIQTGRRVFQNDIKIKGSSKITPEFLQRYLDWKPGEPYSHSRVLGVSGRMQGLRYLLLVEEPQVKFFYNQAALELTVKKKRANKFDFLLGVLPASDFQDRGVLLSVYLSTELNNALGYGERIQFDFRNTKPETQELELGFSYPYILNMPIGVDVGFDLFRNQESNLDLRYQIGFSYLPGKGITVSTFYDRFSSSILTPDTLTLVQQGQLPKNLDHSTDKFGVSLQIDKLDNPISPRRGWEIKTKGSAGFKILKTNNDLLEFESPELPVQSLYDSLDEREEQFELDLYLANYLPFWSRFTFKTAIHVRSILGASYLLENEQYRTGGSREIRGFDEEFFRASSYGVVTGEVRFFINSNSFLSAFNKSSSTYSTVLEVLFP